jgi:alkaline phosphatase D
MPSRRGDAVPRFRVDPFKLGVASGDPVREGVVLWTRLDAGAVAEASGPEARVPVRWEIAEDEAFKKVVRRGDVVALPELGWSVHAEADGLKPGRPYRYRFISGGVASPIGLTRTAPGSTDRVRFAFASCQEIEDGYYTAYRHMAAEELDFIIHLGDYIYEVASRPNTIRPHGMPETYSLDDYRRRYEWYRADSDLQFAHAAFPWVVTWDDHDVDNNYAGELPERDQDPAAFVLRRTAAYQAFYEFMPLRRVSVPERPGIGVYRRFAFGDLLSLSVLDTRQYRDDQACGDRIKPTCDDRSAPTRSMLGAGQEFWLDRGLRSSRARWNVIAQQVMMAPLQYRAPDGTPTWPMDAWDGYPAARQRLLDTFASGVVSNPVVLTGDIHSNWVNDLHADPERVESPVVATELVGSSITTGGDGRDVTEEAEGTMARNPHVRWYGERRGYVSCEVTRARMLTHFRAVPVISTPGGRVETRASWVIESGRAGALPATPTAPASPPSAPPLPAGPTSPRG